MSQGVPWDSTRGRGAKTPGSRGDGPGTPVAVSARPRKRQMRTQTVLLALIVAAPACINVLADVDADENVSFELDAFGDTCSGTGTAVTDPSMTTWTKTPVGDQCQVDV